VSPLGLLGDLSTQILSAIVPALCD
jgi:hypothetical protein